MFQETLIGILLKRKPKTEKLYSAQKKVSVTPQKVENAENKTRTIAKKRKSVPRLKANERKENKIAYAKGKHKWH